MTFDKENWKLVFKDYLWKPLLQDTSVPYANMKKIIVSDCDGVLTDGTSEIGYDTCGNIRKISKTYGAYDKEALRFMQKLNWDFTFVSDDVEGFPITKYRINTWSANVEVLNRDSESRKDLIDYYAHKGYEIIIFIGDSVTDLEVLYSKALSAFYAPHNASWLVKNNPQVICATNKTGGEGAFAEILYSIHYSYKKEHGTEDNRFSEPQ